MTNWIWPHSLVTRIVDGDTFDASVVRDMGFNGEATFPIRLRLNRINTPPINTALGKAAAEFVKTVMPVGSIVTIETLNPYKYGAPKDRLGEWMAEVTLDSGVNVSDALVQAELAVYWSGKGPRPLGNRPQ